MKKAIILTAFLLSVWILQSYAQVSTSHVFTVQDENTQYGINLWEGSIITDVTANVSYRLTDAAGPSLTLATTPNKIQLGGSGGSPGEGYWVMVGSYLYPESITAKIGLGTETPGGKLEVIDSGFPVGSFIRTTTATGGSFDGTAGMASGYSLRTLTSGNMADGFGGGIVLSAQDNTSSSSYVVGIMGRIYARRDGGDTYGLLQFFTKGSNATLPTMTLRNNGRVGIGTTSPATLLHLSAGTGSASGIGFGSGNSKIYEASDGDLDITVSKRVTIRDVLRVRPRATAPSGPSEGDIYVNSLNHHIFCYLNGSWRELD